MSDEHKGFYVTRRSVQPVEDLNEEKKEHDNAAEECENVEEK